MAMTTRSSLKPNPARLAFTESGTVEWASLGHRKEKIAET